jgi:RNA polymerase sigma-54 factor
MKPSLQLRISQNLTMTPQLQQAIRLLQLSTLELQTEIQNALDSNMMLEVDEGEDDVPDYQGEPVIAPTTEAVGELELKDDISSAELPMELQGELPVDTAWDDIFDENISYNMATTSGNSEYFENQKPRQHTLSEHLLWQLNLVPISDADRAIAVIIIDILDQDGYLTLPIEEIVPLIDDEIEAGPAEIAAVLRLIQMMEPTGVGARDLRECLALQLAQLDRATPMLEKAIETVKSHMDLLASHDYNQLMRKLSVDRDRLSEIIALIQSLNPRPGRQIQDETIEYVIPDIYIKKLNGRWIVELNAETTPRLRINSGYANMIKRADSSTDNNSLKEHLQEARWLIKSLQSRSETLLKVATCIIERQQPFLEYGEQAMRPLVLHDIAEQLGMHESTISRVTTRKYMHTPRGIFELKYFFSSHVSTDNGGAASSTAIRAFIKKLVAEEDSQKPLSDSKIAKILGGQGINVARRTVAKYREAMAIPPSNERKQLI